MLKRNDLEKLLQGKKIRNILWSDYQYVYFDENGILRDDKDRIADYYMDLKAEYEEYIEYADYYAAMEHILSGRKVIRKYWNCAILWDKKVSNEIRFDDVNETPYQLEGQDIKAKDWILL